MLYPPVSSMRGGIFSPHAVADALCDDRHRTAPAASGYDPYAERKIALAPPRLTVRSVLPLAQTVDTRMAPADWGGPSSMPFSPCTPGHQMGHRLGHFGVLNLRQVIDITNDINTGWGGRIRTSAWRNQNPLPYRLATPQLAERLVRTKSGR